MNKQRFLTELGRLLTFMYEEDRVRALEMYDEIFDEVDNETSVLQLLVSPTRQAVNLARAYDARERKFQEDDGQEPAYQLVIEDIRRQAAMLTPPAAPKYEDGQISLFNDAEANENVFDSLGLDDLTAFGAEAPAQDTHTRQEISLFPDEDRDGEPAPLAPPPVSVTDQNADDASAHEVETFSDAVDAFLADFAIQDDLSEAGEPEQIPIAPNRDEDAAPEEITQPSREKREEAASTPEAEAAQPNPAENPQSVRTEMPTAARAQTPRAEQKSVTQAAQDLPDMTGTAERRANIPLLLLFILLAVPVGLLCIALILPFAALFLALAVGSLYLGFGGIVASFSFSVFADILLVFGLSLALAAIGLLLLWFFIWLLIGAIPGLVQGICALGRKLCYKEVSA